MATDTTFDKENNKDFGFREDDQKGIVNIESNEYSLKKKTLSVIFKEWCNQTYEIEEKTLDPDTIDPEELRTFYVVDIPTKEEWMHGDMSKMNLIL